MQTYSKTPQLERNWGGGEKGRERERKGEKERDSLLFGEKVPCRKCTEFLHVERISLEKRESL
jgi:hypothetical protein